MKKFYLLFSFILFSTVSRSQSTLTNLVDSLPGNGFGIIESFNGKLYTYPSHMGGELYEIDQTSGALTPILTIPVLSNPWEYTTYSGNFIYLNGKTVQTMHNSAGPGSYVIAAGLTGSDTLLRNMTPFGTITSVGTMAYLLFTDSTSVGAKLFATDLNNPALLIDSGISLGTRSNAQELFYIKSHYPLVYDQVLLRTNGLVKTIVDSVAGANYVMALMGTVNGDMYFTVSHRGQGMDTTWIKKCNAAGVVTVIDTIMMNAAIFDNGLVGLGSKLILPFKHEAPPYHQDLIVYDLLTNTSVDITQNNFTISTYNMTQPQVASNHFYFNTINPAQRYISDGTLAGTKAYGSQASGFGTELEFEDYASYHTLGNKALNCDEYPTTGNSDEFHYGSDTGLVKYSLFQTGKSYPSHFNKIGSNTFFRVHDAAYTKMTVIKMSGCGQPANSPLAIPEAVIRGLSIFPNPALDKRIHIHADEDLSGLHFSVKDCTGREVKFQRVMSGNNTCQISLPESAFGVYFLQLNDRARKHTTKLIIQ